MYLAEKCLLEKYLVDKYLVGRLDAPFIVLSTLDAMAVTGRLVVDMVIPGGAVPGGVG